MTEAVNQSVSKALRLFECLAEDDFSGKTVSEIYKATRISKTTAWRLLKTLELQGWVVETPVAGNKQGRWQVSTKLAKVAHAYQRHALSQLHQLGKEFFDVTGQELKA